MRTTRWLVLPACAAIACGGGSDVGARGQVILVEVDAPGQSTDDVERHSILPIELALAGNRDVASIEAVATAGRGVLTVELARGVDLWAARSMVSERLSQTDLPDEVNASLLAPVVGKPEHYVLTSDRATLAELRSMHDGWLLPQLRSTPGVVDVSGCGGAVEELEIAVHAERLRAFDVALDDVVSALSNVTVSPGGVIRAPGGGDDYLIRGVDLGLDDLAAVTVVVAADQVPVKLRDVADIRRSARPSPCQAFLDDGTAAVIGSIGSGPGAKKADLRSRLNELRAALPPGARVEPFVVRGNARATLFFRIATSSTDAEELGRLAAAAARTARSADKVDRAIALVGDEPGFSDRLPGEIDLLVALLPDASSDAAGAGVLERLRSLPGVSVRRMSGSRSAHRILELSGSDRESMAATVLALHRSIAEIGGVTSAVAVGTTMAPRPVITLDRARMATLGISPRDVADAVQMATDGLAVGQLIEGDRRLSIEMRWAETGPGRDWDQIAQVPLRTADRSWVPLGQIATIQIEESPVALLRKNGARWMAVWIELEAGRAGAIEREIRARLAGVPLQVGQYVTLRSPQTR